VSAHWETRGTFVTAMERPRTLHDFGGFAPELFAVQYPAPGSPEWALKAQALVQKAQVELDHEWGLDHGTWSVLRHLYPQADVPVLQLSLDRLRTPQQHYELAQQLSGLRDLGVLVVGSGNMVHNLGRVDWSRLDEIGLGFDWALEADARMKAFIREGNHPALIRYDTQGEAFRLAVPTPEHFLPLLYCLGLKKSDDEIRFFNEKPVAGALTMTSVQLG
jgi:4,5-DOPA dioxygenase extradiol